MADCLEPRQVNLAYSLHPKWRGHGCATRAVRLVMELARRGGDVDLFVIRVAGWNTESIRVAERLGSRFSHTSDDEPGRLEWFTAT